MTKVETLGDETVVEVVARGGVDLRNVVEAIPGGNPYLEKMLGSASDWKVYEWDSATGRRTSRELPWEELERQPNKLLNRLHESHTRLLAYAMAQFARAELPKAEWPHKKPPVQHGPQVKGKGGKVRRW